DRSLASPYSPLCKLRERVVLEITERASVAAIEDIHYRVAALREMGYRIAIDDLGAGHDRMQQFTFRDTDFVKLDMSLVRDIDRSEAKRRTVGRILEMCRDQGIQVIGEGIETEGERLALIELGCELLQGYLIARPNRAVTPPADR
ncbi:MAG TPA: EAL domain-containing protein, partial [Kofleriaceae bacterium]|nr:EAL domain-containing protein [Kofleriaceae bacterium]